MSKQSMRFSPTTLMFLQIYSSETTHEVNTVKIRRLIRRYIEKYQQKKSMKKDKSKSKVPVTIFCVDSGVLKLWDTNHLGVAGGM